MNHVYANLVTDPSAGEANSSWMMKGLIDFMTSEVAAELRQQYEIILVPMIKYLHQLVRAQFASVSMELS